ncbi:hypothetical protein D1831_02875 [Lactiplantibacillus garii]|uniref:Uncharacterized protein n=1 Tax=Lactiplantibacillus garii TaxID=2306423 RepID=A0A426D9T2_9LACO|nr:hypothetical protein [Lactiplantibacillus garii]RRK11337.1 hypothetical protein D1831_02875 [Lactiplantibacillus garii]
MQVNVVTSVVAGQETVKTADVQAFMDALREQAGKDFTFTLDTDYGQSLTDHAADVYLVYFGSQANLSPEQRSQMIIFYSDEDVHNLDTHRFVDMLQQLNKEK